MNRCYMGIDVGGTKKGFHIAVVRVNETRVAHLFHAEKPEGITDELDRLRLDPIVVAIDCPPRCTRSGSATRLAERQLHGRGHRVQWTGTASQGAAEWMQNGERLWEWMRGRYAGASLIECFPTIAGDVLEESKLVLPLSLLGPSPRQPE